MSRTPGPWTAENCPGDWGLRGAIYIRGANGNAICHVEYTTPYCVGASRKDIEESARAKDDARLMAASFDLLNALRELVRCVRGGDETAGVSMDDALLDADAAIEKAEIS